jgi:hypothetical protein
MLFDRQDCLELFRRAKGHYMFVAGLCYRYGHLPLDKLTVDVHDIVANPQARRSPPSPEPPVMDAMTPDARIARR